MSVTKHLFLSMSFCAIAFGGHAQERDSLDIKIGQMILIGVPGTVVDSTVLKEVQEGKAGSIIFFEKNIQPTDSYAQLKRLAWAYQSAAPIPLFIAIDQEGGKVNRLKEKYGFPRSFLPRPWACPLTRCGITGKPRPLRSSALG